jgi:hypothetical protein
MQPQRPHRTSHESLSIEINGVKYSRIEDVPAEYRALLEDKNNNGIPDFVETLSTDAGKNVVKIERRIIRTETATGEDVHRLLKKVNLLDSNDPLPRRESISPKVIFSSAADHAHNMMTTLVLALVIAIVLVVVFFLWLLPKLS